jgi:hypothetical protein
MNQIYHTWIYLLNHSPSSILIHPPLPQSGLVSTGIMFAFSYMCTHFLHHIHPPTLLPHSPIPLLSHWCQPPIPRRTCSALLSSDFVEEKREKIKWKTWRFSLFEIKVAMQAVSLGYFHVYMYYNPNWFIKLYAWIALHQGGLLCFSYIKHFLPESCSILLFFTAVITI